MLDHLVVLCKLESSSFDGVAGSVMSSSLCECLQISCTSYTSIGSFHVGGMDGHVSFFFDVALIILIIFSCSSFSHCSFCAAYSLSRIVSWGATCTSYALGSFGNVSSSIISWETSYCNTWSRFSFFYSKPLGSTLGSKVNFFFVRIGTISLFFFALNPCCTTCSSIFGCSFYLTDEWKDISTSTWTKNKGQ